MYTNKSIKIYILRILTVNIDSFSFLSSCKLKIFNLTRFDSMVFKFSVNNVNIFRLTV